MVNSIQCTYIYIYIYIYHRVLSNIAAITVLSYHLCYNWIVSCIGIFIGIIIFVTYSFQQDTEYPLNSICFIYISYFLAIISNFFIYYVLLALNNYTCESDNRKLCFLRWKSQKVIIYILIYIYIYIVYIARRAMEEHFTRISRGYLHSFINKEDNLHEQQIIRDAQRAN